MNSKIYTIFFEQCQVTEIKGFLKIYEEALCMKDVVYMKILNLFSNNLRRSEELLGNHRDTPITN